MAQVPVTELDQFDASVGVPQDVIDGVSVASLLWAVQPLTDRTRYLLNELQARGVKRVRTYNDLNALAAASPIAVNDIALVPGYGLYFAATSPSEARPRYVMSSINGALGWRHSSVGIANQPNGTPTLSSRGAVANYGYKGIRNSNYANESAATILTGSYQTVTGSEMTVVALATDVVSATWECLWHFGADASAAGYLNILPEISFDGGSSWTSLALRRIAPIGSTPTNTIEGTATVIADAVVPGAYSTDNVYVVFRLRVLGGSAGTGAYVTKLAMRVQSRVE